MMKAKTNPNPGKTWNPIQEKASSPAAASYTVEQLYGNLAEALSNTNAASAPGTPQNIVEDFETPNLWFYA